MIFVGGVEGEIPVYRRERKRYPVEVLCRVMKVNRSCYYAYQVRACDINFGFASPY